MKKKYIMPATELLATVAQSSIMLTISNQTPAEQSQDALVGEEKAWGIFGE